MARARSTAFGTQRRDRTIPSSVTNQADMYRNDKKSAFGGNVRGVVKNGKSSMGGKS